MTDPHDLDELASAHLDGTTSAEEAERLEADPALRAEVEARAEELRPVARALAHLPPVDAARRDAAIAAALAAFDGDAPAEATGGTVTPLAPRRGLSPRAVKALSAAAVVLLLALLIPLLANDGDDDDTAAVDAGGQASTLDDDVAEEGGQEVDQPTALDAGSAGGEDRAYLRLGSFDDYDDLAAAVARDVPPRVVQTSPDANFDVDADRPPCPSPPGTTTFVLLAVVDGRGVEVHVATTSDGPSAMTVYSSETCELLDEREL